MTPAPHQGFPIRMVAWREIAPNTRHFTFEAPGRDAFAFVPGQFLSLSAEINEKEITRAYSIASIPRGNEFDFCLNLVEQGLFSPYLFSLNPGDEVQAKGPYGGFIFRQKADTICVATGTGIAPFRGMLRQRLTEDPDHAYTLIFGARHAHGLLYLHELEELAREHANFRIQTTLTRPPDNWTGRSGRVQGPLLDILGSHHHQQVFVCGLKEMVDDVRNELKQLGFDRKQINYEKYD